MIDGLEMWREWGMIVLLKRMYVWECVSRLWKRWTDIVKDCLKSKVWMSSMQGKRCIIIIKD